MQLFLIFPPGQSGRKQRSSIRNRRGAWKARIAETKREKKKNQNRENCIWEHSSKGKPRKKKLLKKKKKSIKMHSVLLIYTPNFFQYYIHTFSQILILSFTTPPQVASATHWLIEYCSSHWGFLCGSAGKESTCNAGDLGSIPGLGRSPGEGKGYPLQYSGLENSMDCRVHGVAKSPTQLKDFHFTFFTLPCCHLSSLITKKPNSTIIVNNWLITFPTFF